MTSPGRRLHQFAGKFIVRYKRPVAFLLVGLLNTIFGYGLFAVLYLVTGLHQFALVLATICGILFNYFSTGRLVFQNRNSKAFLPFIAGYGVILVINFVLLELLVRAEMNPLLAQALCLPVVVVLAYLISSRLVFNR